VEDGGERGELTTPEHKVSSLGRNGKKGTVQLVMTNGR